MGGFFRAGKMLADGDLRLIALALLSEAPRHGYEIIKALEQRSSGIYSPSPGVVYPALTFLEEAGYAISSSEGNKKVYAITDAGRQHLEENREVVDTALTQIERVGKKMAQARDWFEGLRARGETPPGAEPTTGPAADLHDAGRALRRALAELEGASDERLERAAQILQRAAADIRQSG
jgi:DNA-binding PadR family transcriptional regulator